MRAVSEHSSAQQGSKSKTWGLQPNIFRGGYFYKHPDEQLCMASIKGMCCLSFTPNS